MILIGIALLFLDGIAMFVGTIAVLGGLVVAGYLLLAMQRTLFGPFRVDTDYEVTRAPLHDVVPLAVLLLAVIALGTVPDLVFDRSLNAIAPLVGGGA